MQLGMIGLGRMGANMVRRLMRGGPRVRRLRPLLRRREQLAGEGAVGAESMEDLVGKLETPAVRVADGARRRSSTRRSTSWSRCWTRATP